MFTDWIKLTAKMANTVPSNCEINEEFGYSCKVSAHIKSEIDV